MKDQGIERKSETAEDRESLTVQRSLFKEIPAAWWRQERLTASRVGSLSLIVPAWFYSERLQTVAHSERLQTVALLPSGMAEIETMLRLGGQALLNAAEFTIVKNMLRRVIKPQGGRRVQANAARRHCPAPPSSDAELIPSSRHSARRAPSIARVSLGRPSPKQLALTVTLLALPWRMA